MLQLPEDAKAELTSHAIAGYPREMCGLLVGRQDAGRVRVEQVVQAGNLDVDRAHDRYVLDPDDFRRTDEAARAQNLDIVGIWHTHPDHSAEPSETDRRSAWEGWSYLIARVTPGGVTDLRSWRLQRDRFVEEPVEDDREEGSE